VLHVLEWLYDDTDLTPARLLGAGLSRDRTGHRRNAMSGRIAMQHSLCRASQMDECPDRVHEPVDRGSARRHQ